MYLWVWTLVCLVAVCGALKVKDAPTETTLLYKAPPTNTRKNGRALSSTIIVSRPLGLSVDPVKAPQDRPSPAQKPKDSHERFTTSDRPSTDQKHKDSQERFITPNRPSPDQKHKDSQERFTTPDRLSPDQKHKDSQERFTHHPSSTPQELKTTPYVATGVGEESGAFSKNGNDGSTSIGVKDKIKFYTLECRVGEACSAIIPAPAPVTLRPSARAFSPEQLKRYLAQFNLRSGFDYSENFEASGTPNQNPTSVPARSDRAVGSSLFDSPNFWPGSQFRPRRGSVYKYQPYHPSTLPPIQELGWNKVTFAAPPSWEKPEYSRPSDHIYSHRRPRPPNFTKDEVRRRPQQGQWNRYGTSTVAQLDKTSGLWVPMSSSTNQLTPPSSYSNPVQSSFSAPHRTKVKLTVMGMNDGRSHSLSSEHTGPVMEMPSALPGRPPTLIETGGSGSPLTDPRQTPLTSLTHPGVLHVSVPLTFISPSSPQIPTSPPTTTPTTTSIPSSTSSSDTSPSTTTTTTSAPSTTTTATTTSTTTSTTTTTTTTTSTTTTPRPRPSATPRSTTPTTTPAPSLLDNPYAVMAAVGAGIVPATFAALLPVLVGRRRRRRRRRSLDLSYTPLDSFTSLFTSVPNDHQETIDTFPASTNHPDTFDTFPLSSAVLVPYTSHDYPTNLDVVHAVIPLSPAAHFSSSATHSRPFVKPTVHLVDRIMSATTPSFFSTLQAVPATYPSRPVTEPILLTHQNTVATYHTVPASTVSVPVSPRDIPTTNHVITSPIPIPSFLNLAGGGNPWRRRKRATQTPRREKYNERREIARFTHNEREEARGKETRK